MGGVLDLGQVVGPQGPQGPKGDTGPQGNTGPQGVTGANGITPNIQVGTVTTLPPGSDAYFTRQEDSPDAAPVFDVGLPRGADSVNDGDMKAAMYDPTGKAQDIFSYADDKANSAETNAKNYAYSKAQSLSAETAEAHGFSPDALPDDMWVGLVPVGGILWLASQTLPDGFLLCDGSNIGRNDYAKLFEVIGTQFGTGDGSTTFTLPDLRAAFVRGAGSQSRYASVFGRKTDATYLETVTTDGPYVHSYLLAGWTNDEVAGRLNVPIGNQDASYALSTCRMVRYGADHYIQNIGRTAYAVRPYNIALTPIIKY